MAPTRLSENSETELRKRASVASQQRGSISKGTKSVEEFEEQDFVCENSPLIKDPKKQSPLWLLVSVSTAMGFCFGFALEKGNVYKPDVIINQMLLRDFTMMKMFLAAAATSLLINGTLSSLGFSREYFLVGRCGNRAKRGALVVGIGAFILGAGMATAGACPGTVYAQMGGGVIWSVVVAAGGLIGALVYSLVHTPFSKSSLYTAMLPKKNQDSLDGYMRISFWKLAYSFAIVLIAAIAFFEWYDPYKGQQQGDILKRISWPPYLSGVIVGMLQLPGIFIMNKTIGSSTSFVLLAGYLAKLVSPSFVDNNAYLAPKVKGSFKSSWWQPTYLLGAIIGAFVSSSLSGTNQWGNFNLESGTGPLLAFVGGFLVIFGSRIADGCTSGHGISGFSQLFLNSIVAVPAMFGGGIITALALNAAGVYPSYLF